MKRQIFRQLQFYIQNKIILLKSSNDLKYEIAVKELDSVLKRIEDAIAEDKHKRELRKKKLIKGDE